MKVKLLFLLALPVLATGLFSCKKKVSGKNVKFELPAGGLSYAAREYSVSNDSVPWNIQIIDTNNVTEFREDGSVVHLSIDKTGKFTYLDSMEPPVLYELLSFSVLPDQGTRIKVGLKWTVTRPTDAEARISTAIVAQEKIDYEVTEVDDDHVLVKTTGTCRIAPSVGLDSFIARAMVVPGVYNDSILIYKEYSAGTAYFDINKNCVTNAEGTRIPFAYLMPTSATLSNAGNRVRYLITLK